MYQENARPVVTQVHINPGEAEILQEIMYHGDQEQIMLEAARLAEKYLTEESLSNCHIAVSGSEM